MRPTVADRRPEAGRGQPLHFFLLEKSCKGRRFWASFRPRAAAPPPKGRRFRKLRKSKVDRSAGGLSFFGEKDRNASLIFGLFRLQLVGLGVCNGRQFGRRKDDFSSIPLGLRPAEFAQPQTQKTPPNQVPEHPPPSNPQEEPGSECRTIRRSQPSADRLHLYTDL